MASKTSRKEWVRGLPPAFGVGRYDRKRVHWASERSVGYGFLIGESVRNHPNLHPYQTGSKKLAAAYFFVGTSSCFLNPSVLRGRFFLPYFHIPIKRRSADTQGFADIRNCQGFICCHVSEHLYLFGSKCLRPPSYFSSASC